MLQLQRCRAHELASGANPRRTIVALVVVLRVGSEVAHTADAVAFAERRVGHVLEPSGYVGGGAPAIGVVHDGGQLELARCVATGREGHDERHEFCGADEFVSRPVYLSKK